MKVFEHLPHINFMKYRKIALILSWSIIVFCLIWIKPWSKDNKIRLGMQFVGGMDIIIACNNNINQKAIQSILNDYNILHTGVVEYKNTEALKIFSIKIKPNKIEDAKDSSIQIQTIVDVLKHIDDKYATDKRLDLNIENANNILNFLLDKNPMHINNQESKKAIYESYVNNIIRTREDYSLILNYNQLAKNIPTAIQSELENSCRLGNISILKIESFSPSISHEWSWKTIKAITIAIIAILIYIFIRFTLSFAIGGIIALIHDILMALSLFVLFGFEFSIPVVASFLILMGYSMTDTIVVFDRIRENSKKNQYKKIDIITLVNDSINQTLSRTILSSLSVLFIAICLLIWGGHAMRDLSFPIFIGVITGTYSSIFIASSMVVYWEHLFSSKK